MLEPAWGGAGAGQRELPKEALSHEDRALPAPLFTGFLSFANTTPDAPPIPSTRPAAPGPKDRPAHLRELFYSDVVSLPGIRQ